MADTKITGKESQTALAPSPVEHLSAEGVLDALKMILFGAPLNSVLESVTRLIEAHSEGMLCTIFLIDRDGQHMHYAAAPHLPEPYRAATDGLRIGSDAGSCGRAAYFGKPVFVADILSDPKWEPLREAAARSGLRAAWSSPIVSHDTTVLGTFGMYYREVRSPKPSEIRLIEHASRIAGIAIERDQAQVALTASFDEIKTSEAQLRQVVDAVPLIFLHRDCRLAYVQRERGTEGRCF